MHDAKLLYLNPAEVKVRDDRVTPLNPDGLEVILASVRETGKIRDAIHVRVVKGGHELIDGRHRLEAALIEGYDSIPCFAWRCTREEARLMEADANVTFTHMDPVDLAVSLAHRKEAYERLHPETKRGVAGGKARWGEQTTDLSFANFVATLLRMSPRNVQRSIAAGQTLTSDDVNRLRQSPKPISRSDIEKLAKIGEADERQFVVNALANGDAASVSKAQCLYRDEPVQIKDPVDEAFKSLRQAWARAPKVARRRFIETEYRDLIGLIGDFEEENSDYGAEVVDD